MDLRKEGGDAAQYYLGFITGHFSQVMGVANTPQFGSPSGRSVSKIENINGSTSPESDCTVFYLLTQGRGLQQQKKTTPFGTETVSSRGLRARDRRKTGALEHCDLNRTLDLRWVGGVRWIGTSLTRRLEV